MYTAVKQVKARGKTRVCKFFLRGRCKFGNRCKNLHFRKKGTPRCRKTKSLSNFRLLSLLTPDLRALILRFLDATGYAAISCVNKHIHHSKEFSRALDLSTTRLLPNFDERAFPPEPYRVTRLRRLLKRVTTLPFSWASRKKLQEVVLALESVYVCSDKRANLSCTIPEKFSAANPFLNVTVMISCNLPSTNQYWQREWVHLKADWRHIDLVKIEQQLSPPDVHATPDCFSLQAKPADGMWELKWQQSGQVHTLNSWQAWSGHGIASLPSLADCNPAQFRHRAWPRAFPHSGCFRGVKRTDTGRIVYSIDLLNGLRYCRPSNVFAALETRAGPSANPFIAAMDALGVRERTHPAILSIHMKKEDTEDQCVVTGVAYFCPATCIFEYWTARNAAWLPQPLFFRVSADRVMVSQSPAPETDDVVLYRVTKDNGSTWRLFE